MTVTAVPALPAPGRPAITRRRPPTRHRLGAYLDTTGARRELLARPAASGSVLVVDRNLESGGDERLLAHLSADEPAENAAIVCEDYLACEDPGRLCRQVSSADAESAPFDGGIAERAIDDPGAAGEEIVVGPASFRLARRAARIVIPELRWTRRTASDPGARTTVSLREAVGEVESYEPFCAMTRTAIFRHAADQSVSCVTLRVELERVAGSSIVLNRGLREAVLRALRESGSSMSEIAMRCGRIKRDSRGNESGETSWLARRVGLLAEGGEGVPTPWVHSDVLGLIARRGLGISPREVELG